MTSINSINGMTHIEATKLRRARVRTTVTFLQIASSRSGRALLTKETGISSPKLLHWAKRAELMKIRDLGRDYSDLLEAVGVESVSELKRRNPESLHESMSLTYDVYYLFSQHHIHNDNLFYTSYEYDHPIHLLFQVKEYLKNQ